MIVFLSLFFLFTSNFGNAADMETDIAGTTEVDDNFDSVLVNEYIELLNGQTEVDLRAQNIDKEAIALAEALKTNGTVRRLNLSVNNIGGAGITALAKALQINRTVRELYLERNKVAVNNEHLRDELAINKEIARILDPQTLTFLSGSIDNNSPLRIFPKEIIHYIVLQKALLSMEKLDLGHFVTIPGGTYKIGSPDNELDHQKDERLHDVTLSEFSIMDAAVTQELYAKVMEKNPSSFKKTEHCPLSFKVIEVNGEDVSVCADHPVENVSWDNAIEFANKLSEQDSRYEYSLPTEAQLEVAFRGGTATAYVTGRNDEDGLGDFVWYVANSGNQTHPVKSTQKNDFGIYRSSVWEWAHDWYNKDYTGSSASDPQGPDSGVFRVFRGAGWSCNAPYCRSAFRFEVNPDYCFHYLGFRLVRTYR